MRVITDYGSLLEMMDVPKPWHISASLLNAKGYVTSTCWDMSAPIERDIVNSLEGICTEDSPMQDALKVVFDSLSNAFGIVCE